MAQGEEPGTRWPEFKIRSHTTRPEERLLVGNRYLPYPHTVDRQPYWFHFGLAYNKAIEPDLTGTGNWLNAQTALAINYTYVRFTAVPIPAGAWLLGSALALLGVNRRRKSGPI